MKKVLAQLFLISFLAVLVVPAIVFAYPACPSCSQPTEMCDCGSGTFPKDALIWCYNSTAYTTLKGCTDARGSTSVTPGGTTSITNIDQLLAKITEIGNYVRNGLFIIAGIFLLVAGYFFVTGGGTPENINKARQMLISALIGVAIGMAATGLVEIVKNLVK